ncbi:permease prefix domain 1-containing protein [Rhodococcus sp. NPDC058514]|uniref:permease prefix domain 1-containing protein n=1 Tax=unclassified Rhodococcus (in: high G+C Gram-positive bacteria) TaxID=192944 RepID=UPI0036643726
MTTISQRYVHAATRTLPEDQRLDVADELRASIADRTESLLADQPGLAPDKAEYIAVEELGDPDRLAAGYAGRQLYLIGPELYPAYVRVLRAIVVTVIPVVAIVLSVLAAIETDGRTVGAVIGGVIWTLFATTVQIIFWVTLTFWLVERGSAPAEMQRNLAVEWTPDSLPDVPASARQNRAETAMKLVWLAFLGVVIVGQQFRSAFTVDGDPVPVLDPDLWSFWLPLVLVFLVAEMVLEVIRFRAGPMTRGFAVWNILLGALFAAPLVFLAATDRLFNPVFVSHLAEDWPGFDVHSANMVVIVAALVIWAWDSVDSWRRIEH